jgi:hypothetical protein
MKIAMSVLFALLLTIPALAQQPTPSTQAVATTKARYTPATERLPDGLYRAEVRRAVAGGDEVAWSSAPHATMADALREACKMMETVYQPEAPCRSGPADAGKTAAAPAVRVKPVAAKPGPNAVGKDAKQGPVTEAKPVAAKPGPNAVGKGAKQGPITEAKPVAAKPGPNAAVKDAKAKRGPVTALSGYEVPGCAFYALEYGKVVQRCPSEGSPGTRPFWHNEDAFEGGYGGGGR